MLPQAEVGKGTGETILEILGQRKRELIGHSKQGMGRSHYE